MISLNHYYRMAFWFILFSLCFALPAQAERVLVKNNDIQVVIENEKTWCKDKKAFLAFRSQNLKLFEGGRVELQRSIGGARAVLKFECPGAESIAVKGQSRGKTVFTGVASASSNWQLTEVSAEQTNKILVKQSESAGSLGIGVKPRTDKTVRVPTNGQIAYIKTLGYWDAKELARDDTSILFLAYPTEPKTDPRGYKYQTSSPEYVMVHYVDHTTPIVDLEQKFEGVFSYTKSWLARMLKMIGISENSTSVDLYLYHYIHNYRSKAAYAGGYQKEFIESPLITTRIKSYYKHGKWVVKANDVSSNTPVVSIVTHCVEYQTTQGNTNPTKLAEMCEGYQGPENVLVKLGYGTSKILHQSNEYSVYEATLPGSKRYPSGRGLRVYVLIHNIGPDEPLFGLSTYENDPSVRVYNREFISKMEKATGVRDYLRVNNGVAFHHHVANVQPSWSEYYNIQQPVLINRIKLGNAGKLISGGADRFMTSNIEVPPRTANEYILSVDSAKRFYQNQDKAKLDKPKKEKLLEKARRKAAKTYGYIFHDRAYWAGFTQLDNEVSKLERYFNGEFDYTGFGYNMKIHYIQFVNHFSEQCKSSLQPDHETVPIVTTTRWVDQFGAQQGHSVQSTRKIYVDKNMANAYVAYWKEFNEPEDESVSIQDVISASKGMIRNLDRNMANFAQDAERKLRPLSMNSAFFAKHDCSSPEMAQLKTNFTRASKQLPSIQAARISIRGTKTIKKISIKPDALYEFYDSYHAIFGFANTPEGWLPSTPQKILKSVSDKYGPTILTNTGSTLRQGVQIEIDGAAAGSLRKMVLSWLSGPPSYTEMIWIWQDLKKKKLQLPFVRQQMYVECRYRGGGYYAYWYEKTPKGYAPKQLRKIHAEHPFLAIQPPREHCPKKLTTPTSWQAYIKR